MEALGDDWNRELGATGLRTTAITVGGGPLGSQPALFGYDTPESQAVALVQAVLASPIRSIDTANGYSEGESERRIGKGIAAAGGLPDDFLVVTKVDALGGDYSGERIRRSVEESRSRLGIDRLPLVHLHDPEAFDFEYMTAPGEAVDTLVELRESGAIGHIGLAGGPTDVMRRYVDLGVFEVLLVHNRWTLVDRSAGELIRHAHASGMGIVNAAVYGGGMLAAPGRSTTYGYRPAMPATIAAANAMAALCAAHGTDLATAALQFSLRDPAVSTTVVGISKPERLEPLLAAASTRLDDEFWQRIEELVPAEPNWLDRQGPR
jgi:D-threo-aldose 1-dehydrogenase